MPKPRQIRSASSDRSKGTGKPRKREAAEGFQRYTGWRSLLNPLWCYHGFRVAVLALTCFGVIMVFSSSSVDMVSQGASPWRQALSQGVYCVIGLVMAFIAMHVRCPIYRRLGIAGIGFSMVLQALTLTPLGITQYGNTGWIGIPGVFTLQPAEVPHANGMSARASRRIWLPGSCISYAWDWSCWARIWAPA